MRTGGSTIKAVIYARYSSHNQREESIEGQIRECKAFAERNELTIIDEYIDRALSGKTDNRPAFQKLISDSEKGKFDIVIMYTLDRFARNRYDSAVYKAKLKKNGVKVLYAKQEISDSPEGIILESVLEGMAEYYSENLRQGVLRGMKENALKGYANGKPPFGYKIGNDKKFHIEPSKAEVVRIAFERYDQGNTVPEIVDYLNAKGYKNDRNNSFSTHSIYNMLKNIRYTGTYKYTDTIIEDAFEPIIDKRLFARVQERFPRNNALSAKNKAKEEYLLTGKIFCSHCNSPMIGESGTSKSGKTYRYYKCAKRKKGYNCNKRSENKSRLEKLIVSTTIEKVLTDDNIKAISEKVFDLIEKDRHDTTYLKSLKSDLARINKKIDNIMAAIEQGIISSTTKQRLLELEDEKERIDYGIRKEQIKKPTITKEQIKYWLYSFRTGDIEDIDYQRKIIDTLINSIYINDNTDGTIEIVILYNTTKNTRTAIKCSDTLNLAGHEGLEPPTDGFEDRDSIQLS